jgi:hypothetical protein
MMMNATSYREYAVDCVRKADGEKSSKAKDIVLNVALAWLRLAEQTEEMQRADGSSTAAEVDTHELAS